MTSTLAADGPRDEPPSLLLRPAVLGLFLFLAVPITALQVVDVDVLALSLLAIPGYVALSALAALVSLAGVDGWTAATTAGTTAFYALHVVWTYAVAVAVVAAGRWLRVWLAR